MACKLSLEEGPFSLKVRSVFSYLQVLTISDVINVKSRPDNKFTFQKSGTSRNLSKFKGCFS